MFNILLIVLSFYSSLQACSDFLLKAEDSSCVVARSMEFGTLLDSQVIFQPQGQEFSSEHQSSLKWKNQYAYCGLTYFGLKRVVDGFNEKGLSIGALWFPQTEYPKITTKKEIIPLQDVADWILGKCASVEEALIEFGKISVLPHPVPKINKVPPLHFALHDKSGQSAVVEFIKGEMHIHANPIGVLTNAPSFEWHITNLRNYINLTAINAGPVSLDGSVLDPTGQGTGMLGIPGDWTPPSRFVRLVAMKQFVKKAKDSKQNTNLAFHLLNAVDIPYGSIRDRNSKSFDFTQWVVVKDLEKGNLYVRTYEDLEIKKFDFTLEAAKGTKSSISPL